ncbi:type 1 glutamine amidotransferase [Ruegeria arenilitoris]|uniref:type 1 glutamine amidotransferase n=1 Tax=Ruegeria arenilitoris TaxID=1173585 RepID=UPI00147FD6D5|nr:type 1 glutamine amidotransferase [Ruegeria arenilitoris]
MRLATLVTNTDFSAFAKARPLDDEKFATLIAEVRPDWQVEAYWVCKGEFPDDLSQFDGVMITGSPASVTENAPWMQQLEGLIEDLIDHEIPVFGACFGHQIIAKSLGAPIVRNPEGWAHGRIETNRVASMPWSNAQNGWHLYGSHIEQVGALPEGAQRLFESPGCPIAGYAIGNHVFTVQHHPEMTQEFIADLVEEYADYVGEEVTGAARASIEQGPADRVAFANEIAAFFEFGGR